MLSSSSEPQSPGHGAPLQAELPSPFILHRLKPNHPTTALEHVTPKPGQETLCAPHVAPLWHFRCIRLLALPPGRVSAALKHSTPHDNTGRWARSHIKAHELSGVAFKVEQEKITTATLEVRKPHMLHFHDVTSVLQN